MERTFAARVDGKGRVLLPKEIRERLGVRAGDVLFLRVRAGILLLAKADNPFDAARRRQGGTRVGAQR